MQIGGESGDVSTYKVKNIPSPSICQTKGLSKGGTDAKGNHWRMAVLGCGVVVVVVVVLIKNNTS